MGSWDKNKLIIPWWPPLLLYFDAWEMRWEGPGDDARILILDTGPGEDTNMFTQHIPPAECWCHNNNDA